MTGGFKLELDPACGTAFPALKEVAVWTIGPNDAVRLFDTKGAIVLDFTEVESGMFEAERKGEGLFFMRTQAAIKAATVQPRAVVRRMDIAAGSRQAALQADAVERIARARKPTS